MRKRGEQASGGMVEERRHIGGVWRKGNGGDMMEEDAGGELVVEESWRGRNAEL